RPACPAASVVLTRSTIVLRLSSHVARCARVGRDILATNKNPALGRTRPEGFVVPPSFAAALASGDLEGCAFTPRRDNGRTRRTLLVLSCQFSVFSMTAPHRLPNAADN